MSNVTNLFPFIISDSCDETGKGKFEVCVNEEQLFVLLQYDWIYEDEVSEYVEPSGRRHFHPNHEKKTFMEIADCLYYWPGSGMIRAADFISKKA